MRNRVQQAADRVQAQADRAREARRRLNNPKWIEYPLQGALILAAVVALVVVVVPLIPLLISMAWGVFWIGIAIVILLMFLYN